jgi:hypothetical protein
MFRTRFRVELRESGKRRVRADPHLDAGLISEAVAGIFLTRLGTVSFESAPSAGFEKRDYCA